MRGRGNINENLSGCGVGLGSATKFTIFPGENSREFERLHRKNVEELAPDGPIEEDLVLTVVKCIWRKWRFQRFLAAKFAAAQCDPTREAYDESLGLKALYCRLVGATLDWQIQQCLDALQSHHAAHLEAKCPKENYPTPEAWSQALQKEIREILTPDAERFGEKPSIVLITEVSAILRDDLFARELECEERIDKAMEHALERLAKVKAAKRKGAYREVQRLALVHPAPIAK